MQLLTKEIGLFKLFKQIAEESTQQVNQIKNDKFNNQVIQELKEVSIILDKKKKDII